MTEAEWLACTDPQRMLEYLRGKASERKLRLFAVACVRRIWSLFPVEDRSRIAVGISERYADALATRDELKAARKRASHCEAATTRLNAYEAAAETAGAAVYKVRLLAIDFQGRDYVLAGVPIHTPCSDRLAEDQLQSQCGLIRDIFDNPFRPASLAPAVLTWHDATVVRLAQSAYDERQMPEGTLDNGRLAVLADALEEAGCSDADILGHLRGPGPHVRGCWVVDLCLGRE